MASVGPTALQSGCTVAILIGASRWQTGYPPAETFANSAKGLLDYFSDPAGLEIKDELILNLFDSEKRGADQIFAIRDFLSGHLADASGKPSEIADVIVVGISHGEATPQNIRDLHLVLAGYEPGYEKLTSLSLGDLAIMLKVTAAQTRLFVLLDCCFSGAAMSHFMSAAAMPAIIAGALSSGSEAADRLASITEFDQPILPTRTIPASGTLLLCSSHAEEVSVADDGRGFTLFGGSLLRCLDGSKDDAVSKDFLSFADLRDRIASWIEQNIGTNAPFPHLYVPRQNASDLASFPILPIRRAKSSGVPVPVVAGRKIAPASVPVAPPPRQKRSPRELIERFLSDDPAVAQESIPELVKLGATVLREILGSGANSHRQRVLLRMFCEALGPSAIPFLIEAIADGGWSEKVAAAPCFAAFRDHTDAENSLFGLLKNTDFDVRRLTIEAIGYAAYGTVRWEIARLAKYGDLAQDGFSISDYAFGKLSYFVIGALVRSFGVSGNEAELSFLEEFLDLCIEREEDTYFAMNKGIRDITPAAVDAIQRKWLRHRNVTYRRYALQMLEHLRIQRTLPALLRVVDDDDEDPEIRSLADICIGNLASPRAATTLFAYIAGRAALPPLPWAVSALYAQPVDYVLPRDILETILGGRDEPHQQLLLALGWRGSVDHQEDMLAGLDHEDFFVRGTSALAVAHLRAAGARQRLTDNLNEATELLEKVFTLAALIHAGDSAKLEVLHHQLQGLTLFHLLRPVWRREILTAFLRVEGRSPRAAIWAKIADEDLDSVDAEFDAKSQFFYRTA